MAEALEEMNEMHDQDAKISQITDWIQGDHKPTNSDEEIAQEVNALEVDPDAKVVLSAELPPVEESQEFAALTTEELEAIRQQRENLDEEVDRWFKMKIRYDEYLTVGHWTSPNDTVPKLSEMVVKNGVYLCLLTAVLTPGEFYVNPTQSWNPLEEMMGEIQKEYAIMAKNKGNFGTPWRGHLTPGFVVGARFYKDKEFYRAKILSVLTDERFKVQFLDFGDIVILPFKEIRYLPLKFYQSMEIQAIQCTLQFNVTPPWRRDEGEFFRKLILDKIMAIRFREDHKVEGGTAWEVDVHLYDDTKGKISEFHVERQVYRKSGRIFTKKDLTTDPNLEMCKFDFGFKPASSLPSVPAKK